MKEDELKLRTPEEKIDDIMPPIFILAIMFAMIVLCYTACFPSADEILKQSRFNEAAKEFNELSFEQRKAFCEDLFGTDETSLDKETYLFVEQDMYPHSLRDALLKFSQCLYVISAICFVVYWMYCFGQKHRLADHPYLKPFNYAILAVFMIAGWPFFAVSYRRVKEDQKKLKTQVMPMSVKT